MSALQIQEMESHYLGKTGKLLLFMHGLNMLTAERSASDNSCTEPVLLVSGTFSRAACESHSRRMLQSHLSGPQQPHC